MIVVREKNVKEYVYVCPCCFNKPESCTCSMLPFSLIQLEKNMWPIIKTLNEKGYRTEECCEGHVGLSDKIYISFWKKYKTKKPLPKGFSSGSSILIADITGNSIEAKKRKKRQLLNNLSAWADSLEKL